MTFSTRLPSALEPNALSRLAARLRAEGHSWIDLTETNPTRVGLPYPADLLEPLADPLGACYRPEPAGLPAAREAVTSEYARRSIQISPDAIVLTASTSEAYALIFKLLCDPGDAVLVPQPSYPLFELLTQLEGVIAQPYRLEHHGAWWIDRQSLEAAVTPRTRAVLVVSPNNPTGSFLRAEDREWLIELCRERGLAIIADEVFADYPLRVRADSCGMAGVADALTFSLGGLSKSAGLPQLKLAWIAVSGPPDDAACALSRLELIADTYLSVSTPVQLAAPQLIRQGAAIRAAIASRLDRNLQYLRTMLPAESAVSILEPEGGWSAVLRVPSSQSEEGLVLRALDEARVLVHPGYFFDFAREAFLIVSLLPPPDRFAEGIGRLLPVAAGNLR
jgi:aspartate/methionine/tyrosine aminotransferase